MSNLSSSLGTPGLIYARDLCQQVQLPVQIVTSFGLDHTIDTVLFQ